jgi:predicted ATPase
MTDRGRLTYDDICSLADCIGGHFESIDRRTYNDLEVSSLCNELFPSESQFGQYVSRLWMINGCTHNDQLRILNEKILRTNASKYFQRFKNIDVRSIVTSVPISLSPILEVFLFRFMPVLQIVLLVLAMFQLHAIYLIIASGVVNILVSIRYKHSIEMSCYRELLKMKRLFSLVDKCTDQYSKAPHSVIIRNRFRRVMSTADEFAQVDPTGLAHYIMLVFGIEMMNFVVCNEMIREDKRAICQVIYSLGSIEAAATFGRDRLLGDSGIDYCDQLSITNIIHPLVENCHSLSFSAKDRVIYIFGNNMSGKSTLLRSIGLDVIARAGIGFGLSHCASYPSSRVRSVIDKKDSLERGESLFLAELKATYRALECHRSAGNGIVLLDEPFSGTNVRNRHAILKVLTTADRYENVTFLICTHDRELLSFPGDHLFLTREHNGTEREYRIGRVVDHALGVCGMMADVGFADEIVREIEEELSRSE